MAWGNKGTGIKRKKTKLKLTIFESPHGVFVKNKNAVNNKR